MIKIKGKVEDVGLKIDVKLKTSGKTGKSAYQEWLDLGNIGSVEDFINSLRVGGSESYIHNQRGPRDTWLINHGLLKFPSVSIVDSGGSMVYGDVQYIDNKTIMITFTGAFSGMAYLN